MTNYNSTLPWGGAILYSIITAILRIIILLIKNIEKDQSLLLFNEPTAVLDPISLSRIEYDENIILMK